MARRLSEKELANLLTDAEALFDELQDCARGSRVESETASLRSLAMQTLREAADLVRSFRSGEGYVRGKVSH